MSVNLGSVPMTARTSVASIHSSSSRKGWTVCKIFCAFLLGSFTLVLFFFFLSSAASILKPAYSGTTTLVTSGMRLITVAITIALIKKFITCLYTNIFLSTTFRTVVRRLIFVFNDKCNLV